MTSAKSLFVKTIIFIAFVFWGTQGLAQTVKNDNYIVVKGAVEGCEAWFFRILDVVKVEGDGPVSLLDIPDISVVNLTQREVKSNLIAAIESRTGKAPETINVEILETEERYHSILKEYFFSLSALLDGSCPFENQPKKNRKNFTDPEYLEDSIQKIQKLDIHRAVI